ncbi:hypothetical protein KBX37_26255 [Micromonospora sp. U56]|uniref:hypothetical protein n=1 Tax=Micromonospora sp. U56 TaxID=2824900 RepID=UPI001B35B4DD|nr:hypothetical protein [Micromonospora sp. U56]MBQ0896551.1 hypothetical protein [Micromonospora sp. U56]
MTRLRDIGQLAVPILWLGMVIAISLIEAPLKFRAPGVSLPIGLGIGRLVFRALNAVEFVLLSRADRGGARASIGAARWAGIGALWLVLLTQAAVLRLAGLLRVDEPVHVGPVHRSVSRAKKSAAFFKISFFSSSCAT